MYQFVILKPVFDFFIYFFYFKRIQPFMSRLTMPVCLASQVIDFSRLGLDPRHKQPLNGLHSNNLCPFFTGRVRAPFARPIIFD